MEHLTTETIENFIKGDYPYQKLLEISAHLLSCPNICRENLNQIDPGFWEQTERLEAIRLKEVNLGTHFCDNEIEKYVIQHFDLTKRKEMNRHFTKCRLCSNKLKDRNPDYLSSFIRDNLYRENGSEIVAKSEKSDFNFRVLVPAVSFAVLLIVFLATILMLPNNQIIDQTKIDQTITEDFSSPDSNANFQSKPDRNNNLTNNQNSNQKTVEIPSNSNDDSKKQNIVSSSQTSSKTVEVSTILKQSKKEKVNRQPDIIVKNRSLNKNCEANPRLAMTPKDEIITDTHPNLTWKPLANAAGYKIYVSDVENNLIEESTPSGELKTSYKLTKKLELNKKYEWKVVVTLTDGKEVYSESAYFSVGEKAKKLSKGKGKSPENETRCTKNQPNKDDE